METVIKKQIPNIAFFFLFASEFTFYLLILQTGIVEYHHSMMTEIWMVPVGGILGIIASVFLYKDRQWLIPFLLFLQFLSQDDYTPPVITVERISTSRLVAVSATRRATRPIAQVPEASPSTC